MLKNYLKVIFRKALKQRSVSLVNLAGLALGIACATFIFLFIRDELRYDRFNANADRIYRLVRLYPEGAAGPGIARVGAPWAPAMRAEFADVEEAVRFRFFGRTLARAGEKRFFESEGLFTDPSFFDIFSMPLLQGDPKRALAEPNSVVLTLSMSRKYFGDGDPVGALLELDGQAYSVTGVMADVPRASHFRFEYLVSFATYQAWDLEEWRVNNFHTYLLLAPGADPAALEAQLPAFSEKMLGAEAVAEMQSRLALQPLTDIHLRSALAREFESNGSMETIFLFATIAILIMLAACINFTNLATARAGQRAREIGLRKTVGAGRPQLRLQFLGESVLTAFFSLLLALVIVEFGLPVFNWLAAKQIGFDLPGDPGLIAFLLGICLATALLSGIYPALLLSSYSPVAALRGPTRDSGSNRGGYRKILVTLQFAVSICLLACTGIIYSQLTFLSSKNLGFEKDQVLVLRLNSSPVAQNPEPLRTALMANPAVIAVSASQNLPGGGDWGMPLLIDGEAGVERFETRVLAPDEYVEETLTLKVISGRGFSKDFPSDRQHGFVLNESAVRELGWDEPLGKRMQRATGRGSDGQWQWREGRVIGVVKDFHYRSLHRPVMPLAMFMAEGSYGFLMVKLSTENLGATLASIRATWGQFDADRPFDSFFLDESFQQMYDAESRQGRVLASFSALALIIGCLGLLGLAAYAAEQRTKEIGIRKVLGASIAQILVLMSRECVTLLGIAFLVASAAGYLLMSQWLQSFAYRIQMTPATFVYAGIVTLFIALVTVAAQSLRAVLANPVQSLRHE